MPRARSGDPAPPAPSEGRPGDPAPAVPPPPSVRRRLELPSSSRSVACLWICSMSALWELGVRAGSGKPLLEPSDRRRAAGGSHVGMSSAYIQLSLRAGSSAVCEASSSADSSEAAEACGLSRGLCQGVPPADECDERDEMDPSELRRKRPEIEMRLAEEEDAPPGAQEEDAPPGAALGSATLGQLELRGVRGSRVAPKVELAVACAAKPSSSAVTSSGLRNDRIA